MPVGSPIPNSQGGRINMIDAIRRTLDFEMEFNPRVLVFGEDVGLKGGVHGATQGMQAHFGEDRVFDTSLNEDGIIGRSTGMALAGLLPIPEIQFRKYADPAHEQLNDLGTMRWRTANHFAAPVIVRMPVGYAKKTGDPWHSVSAEAIYAHFVGWQIAYPSMLKMRWVYYAPQCAVMTQHFSLSTVRCMIALKHADLTRVMIIAYLLVWQPSSFRVMN
jgi:2-oxoisovalerate dehydrogenase E1 component